MSEEPFLELTPNVMLDSDVVTGERLSADEMIRYLPGDFAVKVYGRNWLNPTNIRRHLTPTQLVEYKQYMECVLCRRPCAGLCRPARPSNTSEQSS